MGNSATAEEAAAGVAKPDKAKPDKATLRPGAPLLPERSLDDTDAGWGEPPDDGDERLLRDVPPHWG